MKYSRFIPFCVAAVLLTGCDNGTKSQGATQVADSKQPASSQVAVSQVVAPQIAVAQVATISNSFPSPYESAPREKGGACGFDHPMTEGDSSYISGWSAISAKDGVLPEIVVIGFKVSGEEVFAVSKQQKRDDVSKYFNNPKMENSGFQVYVKKDQLKGEKTATLYQLFQGKIYICEVTANL